MPPDPLSAPDQATESRRRPWGWIALCGVLALAVVGVTLWALSLNSELDDQRKEAAAAQQLATISKRWLRVRDTYGIEIAPAENDALILAATVCIDEMAGRDR
jgi:hypothetical protein